MVLASRLDDVVPSRKPASWSGYDPETGPPVGASVAAAKVTAGTMTNLTATIAEQPTGSMSRLRHRSTAIGLTTLGPSARVAGGADP